MRPRTQKQPQVKKELCRALDDVDVDVKVSGCDTSGAVRPLPQGGFWVMLLKNILEFSTFWHQIQYLTLIE